MLQKNPPRHKIFGGHAEAPLLIGNSSMLRTHGSKRKRSTRNSDASTARHEEERWIRKLHPDELYKLFAGRKEKIRLKSMPRQKQSMILRESDKQIADNYKRNLSTNDLASRK